jgi:hypothetical protein
MRVWQEGFQGVGARRASSRLSLLYGKISAFKQFWVILEVAKYLGPRDTATLGAACTFTRRVIAELTNMDVEGKNVHKARHDRRVG